MKRQTLILGIAVLALILLITVTSRQTGSAIQQQDEWIDIPIYQQHVDAQVPIPMEQSQAYEQNYG